MRLAITAQNLPQSTALTHSECSCGFILKGTGLKKDKITAIF
jgi:hypothetical protein